MMGNMKTEKYSIRRRFVNGEWQDAAEIGTQAAVGAIDALHVLNDLHALIVWTNLGLGLSLFFWTIKIGIYFIKKFRNTTPLLFMA
jgi:hypothetical protein